MGQYYKILNKTKKQYIEPYVFDNGAKLMEFTSTGKGMLQGLSILLANGNGRGGGDLHSDRKIVGSWAGDNIVIEGDYADNSMYDIMDKDSDNYERGWKDVSIETLRALYDDSWLAQQEKDYLIKNGTYFYNERRTKLMKELFPDECAIGNYRRERLDNEFEKLQS